MSPSTPAHATAVRLLGASMVVAALLGGCIFPPADTGQDGGDNSTANTNDPTAGQGAEITEVATVIEPEGSGTIQQTHLGSSRIELLAIPISSDYAFDHWEGVPSLANPVTIVGRTTSQVTAVFVSVVPTNEPAPENDNADTSNDNVDVPEMNDNTSPPANDNAAPPPANENTAPPPPENDNGDTPPPTSSAGTWSQGQIVFYLYAEAFEMEFGDDGDVDRVTLTIDEQALESGQFPGGGEGEGEGEFTIDVTVVNNTVLPGVETTILTITDDFSGVPVTSSLLVDLLNLTFSGSDATLEFDITTTDASSFMGLDFSLATHYEGTMTGQLSVDGNSIDWTAISGTVETIDGFFCTPGLCVDDLVEQFGSDPDILWTRVE